MEICKQQSEIEMCHAHSNAHKPPKPVAPTIFMLEEKFLTKVYKSHQYLSIDQKKDFHAHSNAQKPTKPVAPRIFLLDKQV